MNFHQLQIANESLDMETIKNKKGNTKYYAGVDEKIKAFRMLYPNGGINTKVLTLNTDVCVIHAEITDEDGRVIGSGTASKKQTKDNSDDFIECCESAAVGRALRFLGIGLDNIIKAVPIEDEVSKLIELGGLREKILAYTNRHNFSEEKIKKICERYKVEQLMDLNLDCCRHYIDFIKDNGGNINE